MGCALRLEVDPRGSCGEEEHQLRFYRKHAPEPGPGDLGVRRTLSLRPHWALELALQAVTESPVQVRCYESVAAEALNRQRRCIWTIWGSGGDAVEPHDCPSVAAFVKELTRYGSGEEEIEN